MGIFSMLEVSGAALGAERQRAEVVAAKKALSPNIQAARSGPSGW